MWYTVQLVGGGAHESVTRTYEPVFLFSMMNPKVACSWKDGSFFIGFKLCLVPGWPGMLEWNVWEEIPQFKFKF